MTRSTNLPATVPPSGGALTTTPGTQRIATRMADDLLNVARSRERAVVAQRRYRIGKYEFREADHAQIQRWARMLGMGPEAVVEGLEGFQKKFYWDVRTSAVCVDFHVQDGYIVSLAWDFDTFPLADWAWGDGLKIERLGILNPQKGRLPTLPLSLRGLFCDNCDLTELDLTLLPGLTELNCSSNQLTDLDLTSVQGLSTLDCSLNQLPTIFLAPVSKLTKLVCNDIQLTVLDLTPVPGLIELDCNNNKLTDLDLTPVSALKYLHCSGNQLTNLDLTPVPILRGLNCGGNQLTNLDLTPVPILRELNCGGNQLTNLNLTPVPDLYLLNCNHNQLTNLDLTPVPGLIFLSCSHNKLTTLDVTHVRRLYGDIQFTFAEYQNTSIMALRLLTCDHKVRLIGEPPPLYLRVNRI
jgi:Leucine-rich repeat (LRR) protein